MEKITSDMTIGKILELRGEEVAPILLDMGMHCLGCPSARGETVEEACAVHGTDCDKLVENINNYLAEK